MWTEWEWVNPPMVLNTEYRTTKRYGGKAVYEKRIIENGSECVKWRCDGETTWFTYAEIHGAAAVSHTQAASTITAGGFAGKVTANGTAMASLGDTQLRNIYAGTSDMTAGTTALGTGAIYLVYE